MQHHWRLGAGGEVDGDADERVGADGGNVRVVVMVMVRRVAGSEVREDVAKVRDNVPPKVAPRRTSGCVTHTPVFLVNQMLSKALGLLGLNPSVWSFKLLSNLLRRSGLA